MSMSPIIQTIQGRSLTFMLSKASLDATLTTAALNEAFSSNSACLGAAIINPFAPPGAGLWSAPVYSQAQWAATVATGTSKLQIPDDQIRSILREALIGGGMATAAAVDTAEQIQTNQLNRAVDFLAAQIVQAAIAAG
jgi:hypothetical protein